MVGTETIEIRNRKLLTNAAHLRSKIVHHSVGLRVAGVEAYELSICHLIQASWFLRLQDRHDCIMQQKARRIPDKP